MSQAVVLSSTTPSALPPAADHPFVYEEGRPLNFTAHKLQEAIVCLGNNQEADAILIMDTIPEHISDRIFLQLSISMGWYHPDVQSGSFIFRVPRKNQDNVSKKIAAIRLYMPQLLSYQGRIRAIADLLDKGEEAKAMSALGQLPSFIQNAVQRRLNSPSDRKGNTQALVHPSSLVQRANALRATLPWLNNEHFPGKQFCHRLMDFLDPQSLHMLSQTCNRLHQYANFQLNLLRIKSSKEDVFRNQSPLIFLIPELIRLCADTLIAKDPSLTFDREFRFGLHQWETTGSSVTAIQALVRHVQLPLLRLNELKKAHNAERYFHGFVGRGFEVLKNEWQAFTSSKTEPSKQELFCAALKHHANLALVLTGFDTQKKREHGVWRTLYAQTEIAMQYVDLISAGLKKNQHISLAFRRVLFDFGHRLFDRCAQKMMHFVNVESTLFGDHFRQGFLQRAKLSEINSLIYGTDPNKDTRSFEEHRRLYLSFGEQVQTFCDWLPIEFRSINKAQRLLKNYNLFIRMCNLADLEKEASKKQTANIDDFLLSKLEVFSEEMEHDRARQLASIPYMKDAVLKASRLAIAEVMQSMENYQILAHSHLLYSVQTCRKYRHHLFYESTLKETGKKPKTVHSTAEGAAAPESRLPPKTVDASPGSVPIFTLGPQKAAEAPSSQSIFTLASPDSTKPTLSKTVPLGTSLASMETTYTEAFRAAKEGRPLPVQEALTNAESHLKNMFPLMQRLYIGTRNPLNRQLLFATMIGFMREGALFVEQQLRAILLQTNPKAIPSHNLVELVREAALPLSFEERGLILLLNRAEILSRDIAHFEGATEGTGQFRQTSDLLLFYYRWVKKPDSSLLVMLDAAIHKEILQLCLSLLHFLPTVKGAKQNPDALSQMQATLEANLQAFSSQLRMEGNAPESAPQANPQKTKVAASLKAIEGAIMQLKAEKNAGYFSLYFDNLIHNKLARLHCEMMRHWELSANEVRLHYADLSQLMHLIAEEFMDVQLYLRGDLGDPSSFQHDLVSRLGALGIPVASLTPEEKRFCAQSSALLNVTRYASHPVHDQNVAEQKKKKQMKVASKNERSKVAPAALFEKTDGFEPVVDKKLKALQHTQMEILVEIDALAALLQRLLRKKQH